ncbi:MAG: TolC family protein, partial [Bacteroidota bacterium]
CSLLLLLCTLTSIKAQRTLEVVILSDAAEQANHFFEETIKTEIGALLASQYQLNFTEVYTNGEISKINKEITGIYTQNQTDVLIATGIISGKILSSQSTFPIPSIASVRLNNNTNSDSQPNKSTSGISNLTYIHSPFKVKEGMEKLREICRCKKMAVLTNPTLLAIGMKEANRYAKAEMEMEWLALETNLSSTVSKIPADVEGVYILSPLSNYTADEIKQFFGQINERKLPSFTLLDAPMLELGAFASFAASDNLKKIPRRIALNVEQIAEGKNPKDLRVDMETFTHQLMVNMETVNKIGKYPNWRVLDNALLTNINQPSTTRVLNLKAAIAEGIQNNLGYQIEAKQTQISTKEVSLAKSSYLPQLNAETTGFFLDENTVNGSFGTAGDFNWTAGAAFSQLILSEPALANIAIQKLLLESQQQVQNQSELDVILEVVQRYFNYRQVLAVADLQNENIKAVNQNLTIASNKEKVGYSGASDVYRWQTELDLAKTDLYATNAQLKAAGYQLNETLNRPIGEVFTIENSENINQLIEGIDKVLIDLIQNQATLNQFADFMVQEALQNLPEIKQIELAIAAQERQIKSNKRAFYLPTVAFVADYDYPLATVNPGESLPIPDLEINNEPSWNAAFSVSIPLFAGGSRKYQKEQTTVGLFQLQDQKKDLSNLLELQVRSNLENVNAAYNNIRLTKSAAEAAAKNTTIVQDLYKSGQVDVITLVDAQNALLSAQINATNATYQFMIDYFSLQRSVGSYAYLATETQRTQLLQRFLNFKNK